MHVHAAAAREAAPWEQRPFHLWAYQSGNAAAIQNKLTHCVLCKVGSTRMHRGPLHAHGRLNMHGEVVQRARQLAPVPHPHAAIRRACAKACLTRSEGLSQL